MPRITCGTSRLLATSPSLKSMRLRFPEILEEHNTTAYALAQRSKGRLSASTLYRLARSKGRVRYIDADLLDALCELLDVEPGTLIERRRHPKGGRNATS